MEENKNNGTPGGSPSKNRRRRRRPSRNRSNPDARNRQSSSDETSGDASSRTSGGQPNNRRRRRPRQDNNRQAASAENNRPNTSGTSSGKRRRKRPRKRGNRRVGSLVDSTGRLIRTGPAPERFLDRDVELKACRERFQEELDSIKKETRTCAICGKAIEDVLSAVKSMDGKGSCHFECVQNDILGREKLEENEKLVYIGNGEYAIFQERRNRGKVYYFFRKRIPYLETADHTAQG